MTDRDALRDRLDAVEEELGDAPELTVEMLRGGEDPDGEPDVVIRSTLVMSREAADREGREILGPADTPTDHDTVRVRPEGEPWDKPPDG